MDVMCANVVVLRGRPCCGTSDFSPNLGLAVHSMAGDGAPPLDHQHHMTYRAVCNYFPAGRDRVAGMWPLLPQWMHRREPKSSSMRHRRNAMPNLQDEQPGDSNEYAEWTSPPAFPLSFAQGSSRSHPTRRACRRSTSGASRPSCAMACSHGASRPSCSSRRSR